MTGAQEAAVRLYFEEERPFVAWHTQNAFGATGYGYTALTEQESEEIARQLQQHESELLELDKKLALRSYGHGNLQETRDRLFMEVRQERKQLAKARKREALSSGPYMPRETVSFLAALQKNLKQDRRENGTWVQLWAYLTPLAPGDMARAYKAMPDLYDAHLITNKEDLPT